MKIAYNGLPRLISISMCHQNLSSIDHWRPKGFRKFCRTIKIFGLVTVKFNYCISLGEKIHLYFTPRSMHQKIYYCCIHEGEFYWCFKNKTINSFYGPFTKSIKQKIQYLPLMAMKANISFPTHIKQFSCIILSSFIM